MKWLNGWFFRQVDQGAICPRGYGLCWHGYQYGRSSATVCPVPLNFLLGMLRWFYFALMRGFPRHLNDCHGKRAGEWSFYRHCVCASCGEPMQATAEEREAGGYG